MVEFLDFAFKHRANKYPTFSEKELLELWKEQQLKIVYYETN